MKIIKRAVSCILILTFLLSLFPAYSFAEESDEYRISNDYLSFMFNQKTGGFAIETAEGNPHKVLDNNIPLLYSEDKERSNGTSFITVRIGEKDYVFGQDYGFFGISSSLDVIEVKENGRLIEIPWTIKGITVTLLAALDNNTESNTTGNVGLSFRVQNNSGKDENVSVRLLLDTALGSRIDAPYFVIDRNLQPTYTETEYSGENVPQQIRSVDSVTEPSRLSYILMQAEGWNGGTKPGRVIIGHWANLANTRYDYTPDPYCDFSNYSNSYREPDSAAAIYWENQSVKNGETFNGELLYGVGNFSNTQSETTDIQITTERVELDTDKKSYKNNGEIKVTVNIDNTVDNAPVLSNAIVNLTVDDKQFDVKEGDTQVQYLTLGNEVKTLQYTLKAIEQNDLCAGTIYVSLAGVKTLSDGTQADFETAAQRSIILPSVGEVSEVQINKVNPSTVYTDGEKAITLSGKMKPLEAMLANDAAGALKLIHEKTGHSVTINKNKIAFLDENGETLSFTTDEELHVGEYKIVFELDERLSGILKCDSISAAEKLEVSADERYKLKSYGMAALVRTTEGSNVGEYDFFIFRTESEFLKFYKGESSAKGMLHGDSIKYNFGANKKAIGKHEILVTVRANLYELKDESGNRFLQAEYSSGDIIINNMLSYEGEKPLKLYNSGNRYIIEGDGLLKVINSINVWRSKWNISATKGLAYTLDTTRLTEALGVNSSISPLNLSFDGAASMLQSLGGFAVDLKYGELSSQWYADSDGMVTYGIGFGGSISLPIKAPKKTEVTYETDIGKGQEIDFTKYESLDDDTLASLFDESLSADQEDISYEMTSMFDEPVEITSKTVKIKKETTLPEGQLSADVNNVLFGEKGKVENGYVKVDDTGFIGIDATMSLELPEDLLGSLVTNAPGVYASVTINTIKNQYELNAGLNIKIIECEGVLAFKQVNVKNKDVIVPDKIEFYIRDGLKVPIVPPVLFMAGLGGGINGLADTIGGEFDKLPPITILLFTRLEAINVLAGDFNARVSLEGLSLTGDMKLNGEGLDKLLELNAGISARWIEPWELNLYGNVSIIDGIIKGGITVTIADNYFYGYIFATLCIPDSVPLVGGKELAGVEAAVSHEFIGANIRVIGIQFGVIYYWGDNVSFGKNIDLSPPKRKSVNLFSLESADDVTAYYGTNIHELRTVMLAAGPPALNSAYKEATVSVKNADGQDALLIEIPYSGTGTPNASEIVLINPDGKEIKAVYDDGNGGGNMLLQGREDGNFIYITVTEESAIKNGDWKVRYTTEDIEISEFKMSGVDAIPELAKDGTTITLDANTQKVTTGWTINGGDGSTAGTIDVYLTEDKDILSKIKTSTNSGDVLGVNIMHKEIAALQSGAAIEVITLPDSLPNGKYYAVTTLTTTDGISLAISAQSIDFVNPKLPKPVESVKIAYGGNGEIFVKVTDPENADYTHYLAEIVAEDGTVLENHIGQFEKGENFVFGREASLETGKSYHVNVKTLREEYKESGGEYKKHYYYGMDTVSSETLILPEMNLPKLKEVKVNFDTTGEEINTSVNDVVIEYTFEDDVFVEMNLNENKVYSFGVDPDPNSPDFSYFKKNWEFVLDDLEDGDYVVDFTAYTKTKDHIKGSETGIVNAQLGFTIDTSAPVLSLAQRSIDRNDNTTVIFGANTVVADENGSYVIEGITEKSAELMLDGIIITEDSEGVTIATNGSFKIEKTLGAGELSKEHLITATDKAGNVSRMTVNAVRAKGFSFERLSLYLDGNKIAADTDGVKRINLKNGQSARFSAYAVSDNGHKFPIENDMVDWSVLYAKNALEVKDGTVSALIPGETALKAKLATADVTTASGTRSDGISDYVIINVFSYTKDDLLAEITKAKDNILVTGNASDEDITAYQAAIDKAQAVYDDSAALQTAIDRAAEALKTATNAFDLKKNAETDKTTLLAAINNAESNIAVPGNASDEDVSVYRAAINTAKAVYDNPSALQKDVDSAILALKSATDAFDLKKNADTVRTALAEALTNARSNIAVVKNATDAEISAYQGAIDEANAVYINPKALQTEVDIAAASLNRATEVFNNAKNRATDKTALLLAINNAESNIAVPGNASNEDVSEYRRAIDLAKSVYDNADTLQKDADSAVAALKAATNAFDLKKNAGTDKSALKAEIDSAELNIKTLGNASAEDAAAYQAAIYTAKSVYEDTAALQADVNSAAKALKAATEAFNQKKNSVDKTKLSKEIEAAKENIANVNKAGKTDIEKYQSAIDEATAIYNKADTTQSEIDNALTELVLATNTFNSKNNPSSSGGGGGGSSIKYYDVNVITNDGGSASVSQNRVPSGNSVTITVVPEDGYEIEAITVNGEYFGKAEKSTIAKVTKNTDIAVTFVPKAAPSVPEWTNPFTDVTNSDWFYDNVIWVNQNGLMDGISDNLFGPQMDVTRAMMVTILYRAEGEPAVNKSIPFADVDVNAYYANAVVWAQQNGIVYGVTENAFAPDDNITREQIAAIMFRYAKYKGCDVSVGENTNILSYTDAESVSEYAIASVQYAVGAGLMKGKSNTTLNPQDNAARAEIAAILQRFLEANK